MVGLGNDGSCKEVITVVWRNASSAHYQDLCDQSTMAEVAITGDVIWLQSIYVEQQRESQMGQRQGMRECPEFLDSYFVIQRRRA